jgi:Histidine kinase
MAFFFIPFIFVRAVSPQSPPGFAFGTNAYLFFAILITCTIPFFYVNCYLLLPKFFFAEKKWLYFLFVIAFYCFFSFVIPLIRDVMMPKMPLPPVMRQNFPPPRPFLGGMLTNLIFLLIWAVSSMLQMLTRYQHAKEQHREMVIEKKNTELSYLKAQINPHFLFNSLNSIYSLSIDKSEQTPDAVIRLSDIMRYVTQDATAELVPLQKEIEYLTNYIELQKLRTNEKLLLDFEVQGSTADKQIAPLLLISFIENAFKHGTSNHEPCFIRIHISVQNNKLILEVVNRIIRAMHVSGKETGLQNTRRRLELQYPGRHLLDIQTKENHYRVKLEIELA